MKQNSMTKERKLPLIKLPPDTNYVAAFLSFACQLRCTYCINHHNNDLVKKRLMSTEDWIRGLNRIALYDRTLPITLQGGEPTMHKGFFEIVNGLKRLQPVDVLTNLEIGADKFIANIPPWRLNRGAPYGNIRVSYHHGQSDLHKLIKEVLKLMRAGFSVGVYEVDHPAYHEQVLMRQEIGLKAGVDWRLKEFLGPWAGDVYGTYKYRGAVNGQWLKSCQCKTSELLIDPAGYIFRCHSDLYANRSPIGHLLDRKFKGSEIGEYRMCHVYGKCSACDVKVTNNRLQQPGHTSVDIINIGRSNSVNNNYGRETVNTYGKPDKEVPPTVSPTKTKK